MTKPLAALLNSREMTRVMRAATARWGIMRDLTKGEYNARLRLIAEEMYPTKTVGK